LSQPQRQECPHEEAKLLPPDAFLNRKMHRNAFLSGLCLDLAGGAYTSPPDPLAVLRGLLLREWEVQPASKGRGGERGGKGNGLI